MEQKINLSQLSALQNFVSEFSALGQDYVFSHITSSTKLKSKVRGPIRIDGMTWILCLKGRMVVDVNLDRCELTERTLMVTGPDSIMELKEIDMDTVDAYLLFVSQEFMRNTNIDPNVLSSMPMDTKLNRRHMIAISDDETSLLRRYYDLLHLNTTGNTDDIYVRSISRCLISALCYQVIQFATRGMAAAAESQRPRTRRSTYVSEFMQLVHRHHQKERSVSFYAGKLFISPKYLSLIIKEVTGRSAAEWIDEFVILEAKNMLRFSGKNIQQVAYDLNFTNQSSFGKYFKHLTGMSPSEYQRS